MEIRSHKPVKRKGQHAGAWRLRISYRLDDGEPWKRIDRHFKSYNECLKKRPTIENEIKKTYGGFTKGASMTFDNLAAHALATYYAPAVVKRGVKVSGVKSVESINRHLVPLRMFFGQKKISAITAGHLREYRAWRNKLGSRRGLKNGTLGSEISETTINRELQTMRRMMKDAFAEGWISRDVFAGAKVIHTAHEKERSRILSDAEERALLAACSGTRLVASKRSSKPLELRVHNEYLRCLIVLAVDSGMRKSEILKLTWDDIDFRAESIRVVAEHSKTERERDVPLSARAAAELRALPTYRRDVVVFPFDDFKRSWATAKRIAGIDDLHFHDLRSTAITRLIDAGTPLPNVAKIAGHERHTTTVKHYVSLNQDLTRKVGDAINAANEARARRWELMPVLPTMGGDIMDAGTID